MVTVELIEDDNKNELENESKDEVVVIEKKNTISAKRKKCATEYLAQLTYEELFEHAKQSEAEERDQAVNGLTSIGKQMDTKRRVE